MRDVSESTLVDLRQAFDLTAKHLAATPLLLAPGLGGGAYLKLETVQPTGSFKVRGALSALSQGDPALPIVTASAGNHALGIVHAASLLGRSVTVFVPRDASPVKLARLREAGVQVELADEGVDGAELLALEHAAATGARFVSAYNDRWVIAGQAGVAIEVERSLRAECTIVAPIGGGGLAAGIALWAAARPGLEVVGVEAAASASVTALLQGGDVAAAASGVTIADGLAGGIEPGAVTVDILGRHLADLVTVTENEIRDAMRFLVREHGLVVEPAGAVSVAAILAGKVARRDGQRLVAVLSGRNVTPELLVAILGEPGESGSA